MTALSDIFDEAVALFVINLQQQLP